MSLYLFKTAIWLCMISQPLLLIGKFLGEPHPVRMNKADYIGMTGLLLLFISFLCSLTGAFLVVWG